ncbi:MAG: PadR family transcriptional regulator [Acholeplasmataceae bacterium]|nr:PadR family transcriptional regulator [Acholeplasmataceae bacterium]
MIDESVLNNLINELKRGTQMIQVLSQLHRMQYGYSLLQTLDDKQIAIEAGTLYPLLRRLETQGILMSEWDTSESRPRKYYVLSDDGRVLYERLKEEWKTISRDMDALLKEDLT